MYRKNNQCTINKTILIVKKDDKPCKPFIWDNQIYDILLNHPDVKKQVMLINNK